MRNGVEKGPNVEIENPVIAPAVLKSLLSAATAGSGCAASFFRLPPGLAPAGCASDARGDASHGTADRVGTGASLRLHGQCSRRARTKHLLPSLRRALGRPRLV